MYARDWGSYRKAPKPKRVRGKVLKMQAEESTVSPCNKERGTECGEDERGQETMKMALVRGGIWGEI